MPAFGNRDGLLRVADGAARDALTSSDGVRVGDGCYVESDGEIDRCEAVTGSGSTWSRKRTYFTHHYYDRANDASVYISLVDAADGTGASGGTAWLYNRAGRLVEAAVQTSDGLMKETLLTLVEDEAQTTAADAQIDVDTADETYTFTFTDATFTKGAKLGMFVDIDRAAETGAVHSDVHIVCEWRIDLLS